MSYIRHQQDYHVEEPEDMLTLLINKDEVAYIQHQIPTIP